VAALVAKRLAEALPMVQRCTEPTLIQRPGTSPAGESEPTGPTILVVVVVVVVVVAVVFVAVAVAVAVAVVVVAVAVAVAVAAVLQSKEPGAGGEALGAQLELRVFFGQASPFAAVAGRGAAARVWTCLACRSARSTAT